MAVLLGLGHLVINTDEVFPEQFSTVIFPGCSNECNTVILIHNRMSSG